MHAYGFANSSRVASRLVAVAAAIALFATLLAPVERSNVVEAGDRIVDAARSLVDPSPPTADDLALAQQIQEIGDGVVLEGSSPSLDGRFMLAGPVFDAGDAAQFSVATSTYQGEAVAAATPVLDGDRVTYTRGEVTEWWVRRGSGYEQGWTVASTPVDGSTNISLAVAFSGASPLQLSPTEVELILADGSRVWYRDLFAFDADGTILPAFMAVDGSNVRIEVDAAGASYPVTIDPVLDATEALAPSAHATGDMFGEVVATSDTGDLLAVSARGHDGASENQGAVYIFEFVASAWSQVAMIESPTFGDTDFGWDLDLTETQLVVAAPGDDFNGVDAGAVHVYDETAPGVWTFDETIYECDVSTSPCSGTGDSFGEGFGYAVAIASIGDNDIFIGAPNANGLGAVYVYTANGGTYETTADGRLQGAVAGDDFGAAVDALPDGSSVIIGAPGVTDGGFAGTGEIMVTEWDGTLISPGPTDNGPGGGINKAYGSAVAIGLSSTGDTIAVAGGPFSTRENPDEPGFGTVRVMQAGEVSVDLVLFGEISGAVADEAFGRSVAFANDTVVVGHPLNEGAGSTPRGLVTAYSYDALLGTMDNGGGGTNAAPLPNPSNWDTPSDLATGDDNYGASVAYAAGSGQIVAASPGFDEPENDRLGTSAGQLFSYVPGAIGGSSGASVSAGPDQLAAAHDQLGFAVSVDGNRKAVSAINDDGARDGDGVVYVYERVDDVSPWTLAQVIQPPEGTAGNFGFSLDLEGNYLAIGATEGDGEVAVYEHDGFSWMFQGTVIGDTASLDFGFDVAISPSGDILTVGVPGQDNVCSDCGEVRVYQWTVTEYLHIDTIVFTGGVATADRLFGQTLDLDGTTLGAPGGGGPGGLSFARLAVGMSEEDVSVQTYLVDDHDLSIGTGSFVEESSIPSSTLERGESLALDGDRLVAATGSRFADRAIVADSNGINEDWVVRKLTDDDLPTGIFPANIFEFQPNSFVDVSGDLVSIGRATDAAQVDIFYNDPVYGWGFPNDLGGVGGPRWDPGPLDTLEPTGAVSGDHVGRSVAVDGLTVVAGAPETTTAAGTNSGASYSLQWTPPAATAIPANKFVTEDFANDRLGSSVSVQGNFAAVGEPGTAGDTTPGRVHIFENVGGTWSRVQTILAPGAVDGDRFGADVSLSGDALTLAVIVASERRLLVFDRPDTASDFGSSGVSGLLTSDPNSVALLDNVIAVGLPDEDAVEFFEWDAFAGDVNTGFSATRTDGAAGDKFGFDVALAENSSGSMYAVVSAPEFGAGDEGKVYVYPDPDLFGAGGTLPVDEILPPAAFPGDRFGSSVAAQGDRIVVGHQGATASLFGGPGTTGTGTVHVYQRNSPAEFDFSLEQTLDSVDFSDHNDVADGVGSAVAIDGSTIVVGARGAEEKNVPWRHGAAYSWLYNGTDWTETDVFRADDDAPNDFLGAAVGISGTNVLVGAPQNDNAQGEDSGAVYTYTATAPAAREPIGHWTFDEASSGAGTGIALDSGPGGHDGTINGGAAYVPGVVGAGALSLDGSDDHVDVGLVPDLDLTGGSYTIAFWAKQDAAQLGRIVNMDDGSLPLNGYSVFASTNMRITHSNGSANDFNVPSPFGVWSHTAAVYDSVAQTLTLYIDGVDEGSFAVTGGDLTTDGNDPLWFGGIPCCSQYFEGSIDDIRLYEVALSPGEIGDLIALAAPVDDPTLTFSLDLDGGQDPEVQVAPTGIAAAAFNQELLQAVADDDTSIAAAAFAETDIAASPLSSLPLSSLPLSSLATDPTSVLGAIPLVEIDLEGGWPLLFDDASSNLGDVPINDLTLSDVVADTNANNELNTERDLGDLNVQGTPLSSLPLSSLVLGSTPLSSLDVALDPELPDWCTILGPFITGVCTPTRPLDQVTLMEASLSGVPLSSLPLSSLPLSSLPLSSLPLSSVPLSSLDLAASPLSSLPLSSLPLSSLGLDSIPLSSLPLSSLPLSSLDVAGSPLSSLGLSSLELSGVPLSSLPLSSLPLSSLPLSSLPLSSLYVADAPLSSLDVSADPDLPDWCEFLADLNIGYDCSFAADESTFLASTTIADLGVQGVPLSSLPLSSLPLSSLPLSSLPLSSLPLSSLPLSSLPLSSLPLSSLDLTGTPLSSLGATLAAVPLSSLDVAGSPLSSLPLSSLDIGTTPLSSLPLSSLPLSSLPLSSLPLSSLDVAGSPLSSLPLSSLNVSSTPLSSLPLSSLPLSSLGVDCTLVDCEIDSLIDAIQAGAIPLATTLLDLQPFLTGIRLSDISAAILTASEQDVIDGVDSLTETLADLLTLDDLLLGDIPEGLAEVQATALGDLQDALWAIRFADLLDAVVGETSVDVEAALTSALGASTVANIENLGDATIGDLLAGGADFNFSELGAILGLVHAVPPSPAPGENLGDLTDDELGDLTLLDLIGQGALNGILTPDFLDAANTAGALFGFDMADLLLALVGVETLPFSNLDFTEVEAGQLPDDLVSAVTFSATFRIEGTTANKPVRLVTQLPATATYLPGTALIIPAGPGSIEPDVGENTLTWNLTGILPDTDYEITFQVKPTVLLGSSTLASTATIVGTDVSVASFGSVDVIDGLEPNDYAPSGPDMHATTAATPNNVYLTYIASETDIDVFSITIGENDKLAIQLSSLTADLDIALYGVPSNSAVNAALTDTSDEAPLEPITDPDQEGTDAEPLNDFRRLDDEDATLQFIDLSNSPGTETELLVTDALPAGTYYIQVFGANGVTNIEPAALQVQVLGADARPNCVAQGTVVGGLGSAPTLTGSTANTLILVNQQRIEHFYGAGEWNDLNIAITDFVNYLELPANSALGIDPIVVSVDGIGAVQTAYGNWDSDASCSPESANAVVAAIIDEVVDPLRETLDHIVVLGGDPIIPMARLLDATGVANEYDFRHEFIGDNIVGGPSAEDINALSAAFWDRQFLSDEPYGESSARDLGDRFLYVSDIALGRMVETPDEIEAALGHFQTFGGALDANTAAVLGYDFLVDSSEQIAADLVEAGVAVDDDLADGFVGLPVGLDKWDKLDAATKVIPAGGAPDLISLNGHFDHYRALPADGDQVPNFTNNFLADTVLNATPGLLSGSVVFSMGCHGGLNVSDLQIGDGADNTNGDWAQTFNADQAIFIGNTGFGYGDTEAVAYSEDLMARFAELAIRPTDMPGGPTTTIGQALTFAKNDYASDLSVFSVYDEKALMEATFYGIPFYRVGVTPIPAAPMPDNMTTPDSTGIETLTLTAQTDNNLESTPRGDIYSNPDENGDPQVIVAPGVPVQPSDSFDVSVVDDADPTKLGKVAKGALIVDMMSTYTPSDPVVATSVFNESSQQPEPPVGNVVFPAKPVSINTTTTPSGQRQTLVVPTGQFNSDGNIQRLDDEIDAVVYYGTPTDTDFTAPTIGAVESTLIGDLFTVSLTASDIGGVTRVFVLLAEDPGTGTVDWKGIDLVQTGTSDEWSGSLLLSGATTEVEFLVQAVDTSGNVGFASNKARNFNDDGTSEPDPPAPDLTVTIDNTNLDAGTGWHTAGPVTVTVDSGGLDATYLVQPGGDLTDVPASGVFMVDGEGVNTFIVSTDGQFVTGTVLIDTQAPTVSLAPPADGAEFIQSQVPAISFFCQDPSLTSCTATADGDEIENADPLPNGIGSHDVFASATDVLGNEATPATATYTVIADPEVSGPDPGIYVSSSSAGSVDGISFGNEDILRFDTVLETWSMYFDGSDVGVGGANVDGFTITTDGAGDEIVMSFTGPVNLPGVGSVDDSDAVVFSGTAGADTAGSFSVLIDASDVGLTSGGEDIDAIAAWDSSSLLVSILGNGSVPASGGGSLTVRDEDIVDLSLTSTGSPTVGSFSLFWDGSDVDFGGSEDVVGAHLDSETGALFLSSLNGFNVTGLTGDGDDIVRFTGSTGPATSGTYEKIFDGDVSGFAGEQIDGLFVQQGTAPPPGSADLAVTLSDAPDPVNAGDAVTYTVTVTNNGPDVATNVVVTDSLHSAFTVNGTVGCTPDPGSPCSLGDIASGGNAQYTLTATADPLAAGTVTNSVSVVSATADPELGDNTANEDTTIGGPPAAVDDGPATDSVPGDAYHIELGDPLTVLVGDPENVLNNDQVGAPAGAIVSFGGGDLGGAVTDNAAGVPVSTAGVDVTVNGDGSFSFDPGLVEGLFSFDYRIENPGGSSDATVSVFIGDRPVAGGSDLIYVSSSSGGTVDGVVFKDEDILVYDTGAETWSMFFDGSAVGLGAGDIDGFSIVDNDLASVDMVLSMTGPLVIPGIAGTTDDSDFFRFSGTGGAGAATAGTFTLVLDGSTVGLTSGGEDIDALSISGTGYAISTLGGFNVPKTAGGNLTGTDEDALQFSPGTGDFTLLFDGSDVDLGQEDLVALHIDPVTGTVYGASLNSFNVPGLVGDRDDIFAFDGTLGDPTSGSFTKFFDGDLFNFGNEQIDGLHIIRAA